MLEKNHISLIYNNVSDLVFLVEVEADNGYRFLTVNKSYLVVTGYSEEQVVGKRIEDIYPRTVSTFMIKKYKEATQSGRTVCFEEIAEFPKGQLIFETKLTPICDDKGHCTHLLGIAHDITGHIRERKKTEELLELERRQLLSIFNGMDESVYVSDPDTYEVLYANRIIKDKFGDVAGKKCYKALQGMESPCPFCTNEHIFNQNAGKTYIWETRNKINHRWYRCIDRAIRWPDGRMVRCEMAIDITEYKLAVDALSESTEKYRLLFNNANDAIFLYEMTNEGLPARFIEVNDVACKKLGYSRDEFLVMKPEDIIDKEHFNVKPEVKQKFLDNAHITFETIQVTKNGVKIPVELSSHAFSLNDKKVLLTIVRDITHRKQAEKALQEQYEFLQKLINTVSIPIFYKDIKGLYRGCNVAFESYNGLTREEIVGKSVYDIYPKHLADIYHEKDAELFRNPGVQVYESTVMYADGTMHDVIFNKATFSDSDGSMAGLVGVIVDITERKKMEKFIQHRIAIEGAIAQASRLFVSPEGTDLKEVLKILGEAVSANRAYIFKFRENGSKMENTHEWCSSGTVPQIDNLQDLDSSIFPWWMRKLEHGENIVIPDLDDLPPEAGAEKENLQAQEICSLLVVPIYSTNGTLSGFMGFDDTEKCREWSAEDTKALRVVAEMVGVYWERKRAEEALRESNQQLQQIIEFLPDATFVIDRDKKVIAWNRALEEMTGVRKEDIIGYGNYAYAVPFFGKPRPLLIDFIFSENRESETFYPYIERKGNTLYSETYTPSLLEEKGAHLWETASPLFDSDGNLIGAIESIRDITERKRMEEQLQYLATHDALTNIPNRYSLEATIERAVAKAKRGEKSGLLFIDLDNFKLVNDTLGHAAGDELLIALVNVFKINLREGDFLARLGGDAFAVLIEGISDQEAGIIADKLRRAVYESELNLVTHGLRLNLSISIGIVMVDGTLDYQKLLSLADTALYAAKEGGRNRFAFAGSDEDPINRLTETNQLVGLIKNALKEDLFVLCFQPVVRVSDGKIIHHEALIRLQDKNGKIISPGRFIPVAERFGLMHQIDLWVVQSSLATMRQFPELRLFINLSGVTLGDEAVLGLIESNILESGIDPSRIGFEITETAAVKDIFRAERWVRRIKSLGCLFALDDFGTGFSSFSYLRILPVDYIKIDGSFVRNLDKEPVHRALIQAINTIANTLGKKTIAEFVENENILKVLQAIGIDCGQGFYLGRPAPYPLESFTKIKIS
ncbi:EAL domain-containing protein [Desulfotruncus alcoholivorax]|uniref:EAL domain-containing protein n=1 Tax=Desulfotruncus alcoholivorax TaxID=265477 RepID=UPI0004207414|nr:EAL domain-containing protein [Desulfotruncus alcoholivorax]